MAEIIDGKKLADNIQQDIKKEIKDKQLSPNLAVVLVGDDKASQLYIDLKKKACHKVGIEFHEYLLEEDTTEEEILNWTNEIGISVFKSVEDSRQ